MKQDEIENKKKAFLGEKIIYDNLGQYIWAVQKNGHHQKLADLRRNKRKVIRFKMENIYN